MVASRCALQKASHYFRAMFESGMREASSTHIDMHDIEAETLAALVDISEGRPISITENNMAELLRASVLFQFDQVTRACISHVYKTLSVLTAARAWEMGEALSIRPLRRSAIATLLWHFEEFVESAALLRCPRALLIRLLLKDRIKMGDEYSAYTCVLRWVQANASSHREFLELFGCVRITKLSQATRADFLSQKTPAGTPFVCHLPLEFRREQSRFSPLVYPAVVASKCGQTDQLPDDQIGIFVQNATEKKFVLCTLLPARSRKPLEGYVVCVVGCAVYFLCGEFGIGSGNWHRDVWRWDSAASEWTHVGTMPAPRRHCRVAVMGSRIYLFGGYGKYRVPMTSVDFFDTSNGRWHVAPGGPIRLTPQAVVGSEFVVYVIFKKDSVCVYDIEKSLLVETPYTTSMWTFRYPPGSSFPELISRDVLYQDIPLACTGSSWCSSFLYEIGRGNEVIGGCYMGDSTLFTCESMCSGEVRAALWNFVARERHYINLGLEDGIKIEGCLAIPYFDFTSDD